MQKLITLQTAAADSIDSVSSGTEGALNEIATGANAVLGNTGKLVGNIDEEKVKRQAEVVCYMVC